MKIGRDEKVSLTSTVDRRRPLENLSLVDVDYENLSLVDINHLKTSVWSSTGRRRPLENLSLVDVDHWKTSVWLTSMSTLSTSIFTDVFIRP